MKYIDQRRKMIETQIINRGVTSKNILNAFLEVKRHLFVPENSRHFAYSDTPLSIGNSQTISQPFIVAEMLDLLEIEPSDKVLEIGTGSGYQTAILAELCSEVYTIERIAELSKKAQKILESFDYKNIHFSISDGTKGWEKDLSLKFDKIIVSAASPKIPPAYLKQLANYGKLIIPCGNKDIQELELISKHEKKLRHSFYGSCRFVPLIGKDGWE